MHHAIAHRCEQGSGHGLAIEAKLSVDAAHFKSSSIGGRLEKG